MQPMNVAAGSGARANSYGHDDVAMAIKFHNVYRFECYDADGNLKWVDETTNVVTTVGKNDLLTNYFKGSAYTAAFFIGLFSETAPTLLGSETMASHAAFTESVIYSNSTRPAWTGGTASAGSIDNSASQAVFTINASGTVGGAFLVTNSTKSGTTGILYGEATLSAPRTLSSGDTLNITVTLTV